MGPLIIYLLKVATCQALFWLAYRLLLSRDTFHSFNRFVLCLLQALAFIVPLVQVSGAAQSAVATFTTTATVVIMQQTATATETASGLSVVQVLFLIYIIGIALLAAFSLTSIIRVRRILRCGESVETEDNLRITRLDYNIAPFSWFSHIVIGRTENEADSRAILQHEIAHVRLRHSLDAAVFNLLTALTWFNPFAWLLRRELSEVHEYEADAAVLNEGFAPTNYQLMLIRRVAGERLFALANNFHAHSLKKRITMMNTRPSRLWHRAKALVIVPLALVAVVALATPALTADNATAQSAVLPTQADTLKAIPAAQAQVPPTYPGGEKALVADISRLLVNPSSEEVNGIVIAEFEIRTDGSIGNIKIKKSLNPTCDEAVRKTIRQLSRFNPAKQDGKAIPSLFTLPIRFSHQ